MNHSMAIGTNKSKIVDVSFGIDTQFCDGLRVMAFNESEPVFPVGC